MGRRRGRAGLCLLVVALWVPGCGGGDKASRKEFELALRGGALPSEQQVIRVRAGDDVILRWTTDEPVTVHLHGYDVEKELTPGAPVTMWFVARATGRFPIVRHRGSDETTVGYLEVHPR